MLTTGISGRFAGAPSEGALYPIFSYGVLLSGTFLVHGMGQSAKSLGGDASLISKVKFVPPAIPLDNQLAGLLAFSITFVWLLGVRAYWQLGPMGAIPTKLAAFWPSVLNVQCCDLWCGTPFLKQISRHTTPIASPRTMQGSKWTVLFPLNRIVGVVEGLGCTELPNSTSVAASTVVKLVALIGGLFYFGLLKPQFANVV